MGDTKRMDGRMRALALGMVLGASSLLFFLACGKDEAALRGALRVSGRVSFVLWWLTFIASPLGAASWITRHALPKVAQAVSGRITRALRVYRPRVGLAFAGSHTVHAALIVSLVALAPAANIPWFVVAFGGTGFVAIAAMAITTFPSPARRVGPVLWKRIHTVGTWFISIVFAYDLFLKPANLAALVVWPFALALAAAYALRLAVALRAKSTALETHTARAWARNETVK